jgi:hypothetical protein
MDWKFGDPAATVRLRGDHVSVYFVRHGSDPCTLGGRPHNYIGIRTGDRRRP